MHTRFLIAERYGQSDVLDIKAEKLPSLQPAMARVAVRTAGINPIDVRRMTGEVRFGPLPLRFGVEFAGIITDLPSGTRHWSIGDEVLGSANGLYTHSTIIDVPADNLIRRPPAVDWLSAGSMAGTAQTAMTILHELGKIDSLLVHGGSGGVGTVLVQLAREKGIRVVATASQSNNNYLHKLGAIPVTYGFGLTERIRNTHPVPFDAAVILADTRHAADVSLATVKPDGDIISITGIPVPNPRIKPLVSKLDPNDLQNVVELVAKGKIKWEISETYSFNQAREGFAAVLQGHTRGKRVLVFSDEVRL